MDNTFKTWDINQEEDNLEDGVLVLKQVKSAIFYNDQLPSTVTFWFDSAATMWRHTGQLWWCKKKGKVDKN